MRNELRTDFTNRQYMLSKDYELFYYNDPKFTPTSSHSHPYYEFYFFINGDIELKLDNDTYQIRPGDMVLIPPGIQHHAVSKNPNKPYQRIIFWISDEFFAYFRNQSTDYEYIINLAENEKKYVHNYDTITFNMMQSKLIGIIQETHQERYGRDTMIKVLISDLLIDINRVIYEANNPQEFNQGASLYQNLIIYINNHLTENITLENLAKQFFVSQSYISHTFKSHFSLSIHQYILKKRLQLFKDSLRDNLDILSTYQKCGFNDYSSFYRAFKKEYGISPNEFRNDLLQQTNEIVV